MAHMLQIKITVISNNPTRDMAFNITDQQEIVIAHLDLPNKQHWIDTVLYAVPASTTRQDGEVTSTSGTVDLSATCQLKDERQKRRQKSMGIQKQQKVEIGVIVGF